MTTKTAVPTTNVGTSGNVYIDGVLWGTKINAASLATPNVLHFSFPSAGSNYGGAGYNSTEPAIGFTQFSAAKQARVHAVLAVYATIIPLTYSEITESDTAHAEIRFAGTSAALGPAESFIPGDANPSAGSACDVWFRNDFSSTFEAAAEGEYGGITYWHEIGHAHGLKHAHGTSGNIGTIVPTGTGSVDGSGNADEQDLFHTVMSYRTGPGASTSSWSLGDGNMSQSLMMLDIAGLQYYYGAYTATANKTYTFSPTTGEMSIEGVGQGVPYANKILRTIYYGESNVTNDFSNFSTDQTISMRPGEWSTINASQLSVLNGTTAPGNIANALNTANLLKNVKTGTGANTVKLNKAATSTITGNTGTDTVVFACTLAQISAVKNSNNNYTLTDATGGASNGAKTLINCDYAQFSDHTVPMSDFDNTIPFGTLRLLVSAA